MVHVIMVSSCCLILLQIVTKLQIVVLSYLLNVFFLIVFKYYYLLSVVSHSAHEIFCTPTNPPKPVTGNLCITHYSEGSTCTDVS